MNKAAFAAPRCPGTLKEGLSTYCPATLRKLFSGKQVFHVLNESFSEKVWRPAQIQGAHFGGQQWFRMRQEKNQLVPDKSGVFILKTVFHGGSSMRFHMEQPGNEHLCLQLASQVFQMETFENALIFFPDGQPAVISNFFSTTNGFMNFETLQQKISDKPISNYRQMALLIDTFCAASMIAKERLFIQVVFEWLIGNSDAQSKNFGVVKTIRGDDTTAPLFNSICTRLHELGPELALSGGLFEGDKHTPEFRENGSYTRNEFTAFGNRIGMLSHRIEKVLNDFVSRKENALQLIDHAFLPDEAKAIVRFNFLERLNRLK